MSVTTAIHVTVDDSSQSRRADTVPQCIRLDETRNRVFVGRGNASFAHNQCSSFTFDHIALSPNHDSTFLHVVAPLVYDLVDSAAVSDEEFNQVYKPTARNTSTVFLYGPRVTDRHDLFKSLAMSVAEVGAQQTRIRARELHHADPRPQKHEERRDGRNFLELSYSLCDVYRPWGTEDVLDPLSPIHDPNGMRAINVKKRHLGSRGMPFVKPRRKTIFSSLLDVPKSNVQQDWQHVLHSLEVRDVLRILQKQSDVDQHRSESTAILSFQCTSALRTTFLHLICLPECDSSSAKNRIGLELSAVATTLHLISSHRMMTEKQRHYDAAFSNHESMSDENGFDFGVSMHSVRGKRVPMRESSVLMYLMQTNEYYQRERSCRESGYVAALDISSQRWTPMVSPNRSAQNRSVSRVSEERSNLSLAADRATTIAFPPMPSSDIAIRSLGQAALIVCVNSSTDYYSATLSACHFAQRAKRHSVERLASANHSSLQKSASNDDYEDDEDEVQHFIETRRPQRGDSAPVSPARTLKKGSEVVAGSPLRHSSLPSSANTTALHGLSSILLQPQNRSDGDEDGEEMEEFDHYEDDDDDDGERDDVKANRIHTEKVMMTTLATKSNGGSAPSGSVVLQHESEAPLETSVELKFKVLQQQARFESETLRPEDSSTCEVKSTRSSRSTLDPRHVQAMNDPFTAIEASRAAILSSSRGVHQGASAADLKQKSTILTVHQTTSRSSATSIETAQQQHEATLNTTAVTSVGGNETSLFVALSPETPFQAHVATANDRLHAASTEEIPEVARQQRKLDYKEISDKEENHSPEEDDDETSLDRVAANVAAMSRFCDEADENLLNPRESAGTAMSSVVQHALGSSSHASDAFQFFEDDFQIEIPEMDDFVSRSQSRATSVPNIQNGRSSAANRLSPSTVHSSPKAQEKTADVGAALAEYHKEMRALQLELEQKVGESLPVPADSCALQSDRFLQRSPSPAASGERIIVASSRVTQSSPSHPVTVGESAQLVETLSKAHKDLQHENSTLLEHLRVSKGEVSSLHRIVAEQQDHIKSLASKLEDVKNYHRHTQNELFGSHQSALQRTERSEHILQQQDVVMKQLQAQLRVALRERSDLAQRASQLEELVQAQDRNPLHHKEVKAHLEHVTSTLRQQITLLQLRLDEQRAAHQSEITRSEMESEKRRRMVDELTAEVSVLKSKNIEFERAAELRKVEEGLRVDVLVDAKVREALQSQSKQLESERKARHEAEHSLFQLRLQVKDLSSRLAFFEEEVAPEVDMSINELEEQMARIHDNRKRFQKKFHEVAHSASKSTSPASVKDESGDSSTGNSPYFQRRTVFLTRQSEQLRRGRQPEDLFPSPSQDPLAPPSSSA